MKIIFLCLLALISVALYANMVTSNAVCYSSGDPHYRTFTGYSANLYNPGGDYLLTSTPRGKFAIVTRIGYSKNWNNKGLNTAFAMRVDNNHIEHYGNSFRINGKKNKVVALRNGARLSATKTRWIVQSKSGIVVDINMIDLRNTGLKKSATHYFNIIVRMPTKFKGQLSGLCGSYVSKSADIALWKKTNSQKFKNLGGGNLFSVKYDQHFNTPYKPNNVIVNKWNNAQYRAKVYAFCRKMKLTGNLFNDCVYDIRISGKFSVSASYSVVAKDIKKLNIHSETYTKGVAGARKSYLACLASARKHRNVKTRNYLTVTCQNKYRNRLAQLTKVHKCSGIKAAYLKENRLASHYLSVYRDALKNKQNKRSATYMSRYRLYIANAKRTLVTYNKCRKANATVQKCARPLNAYRNIVKQITTLKNRLRTLRNAAQRRSYQNAIKSYTTRAHNYLKQYRMCSTGAKPKPKPKPRPTPRPKPTKCAQPLKQYKTYLKHIATLKRRLRTLKNASTRKIYQKALKSYTTRAHNYLKQYRKCSTGVKPKPKPKPRPKPTPRPRPTKCRSNPCKKINRFFQLARKYRAKATALLKKNKKCAARRKARKNNKGRRAKALFTL